jgi:hypothetical protein
MESELDRILADLYSRNKRLAEQLLEKQIISVEELEKLLGNEQIPLGQLLLDEKLILQYELKIALLEQQLNSKKLGEILVEQQAISLEQLTKVLHKQAWQIEKSKMSNISN